MWDAWDSPIWPVEVLVDSTSFPYYETVNYTLWQLGNAYIASGREVQSNHAAWVAAGVQLSDTRDWNFIIKNVEVLSSAYSLVLDKLVFRTSRAVEVRMVWLGQIYRS